MSATKMKLGPDEWVNPEPLLSVFGDAIDRKIVEPLLNYRSALKGLKQAIAEADKGTLRQKLAIEAQEIAIAKAVAQGKSPQQIFDKVGPLVFMPNDFARNVVKSYVARATETRSALGAILARHKDQLLVIAKTSKDLEARTAIKILEAV